VLTGGINLKINTLEVKTVEAMGLLSCYMTVLSAVAGGMYLKKWKVM
jgi:hypothetical protein